MAGTNEENGRMGGRKRTVVAMGIVCAALLAVGILCRARIHDSLMLGEDAQENRTGSEVAEEEDNVGNDIGAENGLPNDAKGNSSIGDRTEAADRPQNDPMTNGSAQKDAPHSDFFRQIAEIIWEKDWEDIGPEEYAQLTSIQIDRAGGMVSYQLNHGYVGTFVCPEGLEEDFTDLSFFKGLEWISVDCSLKPEDLRGLENLFSVCSRNTVKEFTQIIPCPGKITELGIGCHPSQGSSSEKNLEGIESFPNLQYLSVSCEALEDISALKQFPNLRGLILEGCRKLQDYGSLLSLGDLEWLKISGCRLESIDFILSLPKLTSLSLENVAIMDWAEGLFGIPTLRNLYLNDCRIGLDFDRMPTNEELEVLSLNRIALLEDPAREDGSLVSLSEHCDIFAGLPNLTELHLVSLELEDIGFVEKLPHLQYLDITGNPVKDMGPLEHLKELRGIGYGEERKWGDLHIL